MKIVFVDAPHRILAQDVMFRTWTPSVGVAYLAACLEKDHDVRVLDAMAYDRPWDDLEAKLREEKPDVIGITSCATCWAPDAMNAARLARWIYPDVPILAGGQHFSLMPEDTLRRCPEVDFVAIGEAEYTLQEMLPLLADRKPKEDFADVAGLAFLVGDEYVQTPARPLIKDLDSLPMPAWHLFPMDSGKYMIEMMPPHRSFTTTFSRGCVGTCSFCAEWKVWNRTWRTRNAKKMVDELQFLAERYGRDIYLLGDNDFFFSRKRNIEYCEEMEKRKVPIHLWIQSRTDHVIKNRDLMPRLRANGVFAVLLGVESIRPEQLDAYRKNQTVEQIKEAVSIIRENRMMVQTMFMFGAWNDDEATMRSTFQFARDHSDFPPIVDATPLPGTDFYQECVERDNIENHNWIDYDYVHPIVRTEALTIPEIEALRKICEKEYRPGAWQFISRTMQLPLKRVFLKEVALSLWRGRRHIRGTYVRQLAELTKTFEQFAQERGFDLEGRDVSDGSKVVYPWTTEESLTTASGE